MACVGITIIILISAHRTANFRSRFFLLVGTFIHFIIINLIIIMKMIIIIVIIIFIYATRSKNDTLSNL